MKAVIERGLAYLVRLGADTMVVDASQHLVAFYKCKADINPYRAF